MARACVLPRFWRREPGRLGTLVRSNILDREVSGAPASAILGGRGSTLVGRYM